MTNAVQIQLARRTLMCQLHVPVQIFLMEVGSIAQAALKLPDTSMLLESWILLTAPLM